jgi:hypothetical protein
MGKVKNKIVGIPLQKEEISATIGELLGDELKINILQAEAKEVDPGDMNVNAYYDPDEDMFGRTCIELILVYSPLDNILIVDEEGWVNIVRRLADAIAHEQRHLYQYRQRDWEIPYYDNYDEELDEDINTARDYLGNKDEIDAFSFNIANELLDSFDYKEVFERLSNPKKIDMSKSVNLWAYMCVFGMNFSDPVLKRLMKKIYRVLPEQAKNRE